MRSNVIDAVNECDMGQIKKVVNSGADVNEKDANGGTPLHRACAFGSTEMCEMLLDAGADVNLLNIDTPLHRAACYGHVHICQLLLKRGADINGKSDGIKETPLHSAVRCGQLDVCKFLLDNGADINATDGWGRTPVYEASVNSNVDIFDFLIERGADVNIQCSNGYSPLFFAVLNGKSDFCKRLIECGADVNLKDGMGNTVLHKVASESRIVVYLTMIEHLFGKLPDNEGNWNAVCKVLLDAGANVNVENNCGDTPLHLAALSCNLPIVEILLEHGANPSAVNKYGCSPMDYSFERCVDSVYLNKLTPVQNDELLVQSVLSGDVLEVKKLLRMGANPNAKDESGTPVVTLASTAHRKDIVSILIENGACVKTDVGHP